MKTKNMPTAAAVAALVCASTRGTASHVAAVRCGAFAGGGCFRSFADPVRRSCLPRSTPSGTIRESTSSTAPQPSRKHRAGVGSSLASTTVADLSLPIVGGGDDDDALAFRVNLHTIPLPELEELIASWGHPAFRARQIHKWIRNSGASSFDEMTNIPKKLRDQLAERAVIGSLDLAEEQISTDGTKKRAYRLHDGQLIESVLMPYEDGRNTACVSSQAGCAMGCVFCATGQMGFARQLSADEIFEQVARFASELRAEDKRLSNVVMMGMGEPLANYRNVLGAVRRMNEELGIAARKITVSTVGVVPNIRKLMNEDLQVRLAVSLHCANDEERTALLPANKRYGGLDELMSTIREYIETTRRRVTFEWALIEGQNDTPEVARQLGRLLKRHGIRSDMAHVNLIPLNPTGGFDAGPSGRASVGRFVSVLEDEFRISATPRMRRGIDINAGCGQLKSAVKKKEKRELDDFIEEAAISSESSLSVSPQLGVYEELEEGRESDLDILLQEAYEDGKNDVGVSFEESNTPEFSHESVMEFSVHEAAVNIDDAFEDEDFDDNDFDSDEAERLLSLFKGTSLTSSAVPTITTAEEPPVADEIEIITKTTTITDEDSVREAKRRRKKLLKNLKAIQKLRDMEVLGKVLNEEQLEKVAKHEDWTIELEDVEHNLM